MPVLYSGKLTDNRKEYLVKCILDKDIKINIYSPTQSTGIGNLLTKGALGLENLMVKPRYHLLGSYVSYIERDEQEKRFYRRTLLHGNVKPAYRILELVNQSYIVGELKNTTEYPSAFGVITKNEYEKELTSGKITQYETLRNGVLQSLTVQHLSPTAETVLELNEDGKAPATPTKGIEYHESVFDVGDVKENAIHTQVRSIQHLRSIKDLSWIDKAIQDGRFILIDELEALKEQVNIILADLKRAGETKVYYDTEGTGLNIFNLPPDHPEFDMMAAHILSWVSERRDDGYPLKVTTMVVPVGMKYCKNVDEIEASQALKPLLTNPDIGVASHNAEYEIQINLRYSEIEGELSYSKYYQWKKELEASSFKMDREWVQEQLHQLKTEYEEKSKGLTGLIAKLKLRPLQQEIERLERGLDVDQEVERVRNLPKEEKPYLSDVKGEDIYRVNIKYDTLVLSRMVNNGGLMRNGNPFFKHRLEVLTENYLGLDQLSLDDIYGNSQSSKYKIYDFSLLPKEFLYYYACPDTYVMPFIEWHLERQAYEHMISLGATEEQAYNANIELLNLYYNVDTPFACHMAEFANYKGIAVDKKKLDEQKYVQEYAMETLLQTLKDMTGEDIQWTSDKQVKPLIFSKYRYPILYYTDKKVPSYNKLTRKHHIKQKKNDHEKRYDDVVPIKELKEDVLGANGEVLLKASVVNELQCPISYVYQEFMNRYKDLTSFTKMVYERSYLVNGEWIFFPSYIATSTDTGRASGGIMIMKSSKKDIFVARKGSKLVGGDLNQAELRLISTMSGDIREIERFKQPRYDPHTQTAAEVNEVDVTEVTGEQRQAAKVINFGYAYSMGPEAAANNIYKDLVPVPKPLILKTAILLKGYARANPVKDKWLRTLRETTVKIGYSKTPMGRYKWFPETRDPDTEQWELARAGRQGGNIPVQGFCADFIKQRIVSVYNVIKECNISRYFTQPLFIHDEFHSEVKIEAFANARNEVYTNEMVKEEQQFPILWLYELIQREFTDRPLGISYFKDEAPMTLGIGLANNWMQVKSDLYGCPLELQEDIINKYRNGEIPDDLHQALCERPDETMLDLIRKWWASELMKELEKGGVDPLHIPPNVADFIEDLYIKRGIKDIFPVSPEELKEMGLGSKDFTTGQVIKAMKYLKGEEVELVEVLENDDEALDDEAMNDALLAEVVDLDVFRQMKNEQLESMKDEDLDDYDYVFAESKLLEYGKLMVNEEGKEVEINIDGMLSLSVIELEKLIRMNDGSGVYNVIIVARKPHEISPYRVIRTTYHIRINEDILLQIKSIMEKDAERSIELEKRLAKRIM